ncbi:hypothetical protein DPEC_G00248760 [Dallia pectoralis]|uniref:Uncharacterized protein n=1 Tax=Dallia pectoralis TaxID=75939 RepID=A0ACC2FSM5_DALPE|nr:hypothetical protein DPEC_G00248760 [Dallia pectoralis]
MTEAVFQAPKRRVRIYEEYYAPVPVPLTREDGGYEPYGSPVPLNLIYRAEMVNQQVVVRDPEHMQALYNKGYFGKGILSRSRPDHSVSNLWEKFGEQVLPVISLSKYQKHTSWARDVLLAQGLEEEVVCKTLQRICQPVEPAVKEKNRHNVFPANQHRREDTGLGKPQDCASEQAQTDEGKASWISVDQNSDSPQANILQRQTDSLYSQKPQLVDKVQCSGHNVCPVDCGSRLDERMLETEWQGTEWQGTEWQGTEWQGTEWQGTEWQGTEWQGTEWQGTEWQGTEWQGTEWQGTERQGTERQGTERQGTERQGTERQGTERHGRNVEYEYVLVVENEEENEEYGVIKPIRSGLMRSEATSRNVCRVNPFRLLEYLQLTLEEAFFLVYTLGCLSVYYNKEPLSVIQVWEMFRSIQPHFETSYIAYHFFRSRGWVPKPGVKYGTDLLLYRKGPPFYHASYSVVVERVSQEFTGEALRPFSWRSLAALSRITGNVSKELMLCYVIYPSEMKEEHLSSPHCLSTVKVQELILSRWIPSQERTDMEDI